MPKLQTRSPWETHRDKWCNCQLCPYSEHRKKVALVRGTIPCDVLFIGEAPGASEDVLGSPFTGPAGKLLDSIIARASRQYSPALAFTNLVGCIPLKDPQTRTIQPPNVQAITACRPRLSEIYAITGAKAVICVGALASKYVPDVVDFLKPGLIADSIIHPASILRLNASQVSMACDRTADIIESVFEALQIPPF